MAKWTSFFLIRIEFLGFRYHGWQKQAKLRSVQGMVDKTFEFIFGHTNFKTLGCGRTDAKVSANDFAFELFLNENIDVDNLFKDLNTNLPSDIRAKSIEIIDAGFNIIQHPKIKEYHYLFSFGEKSHPFNAPFIRDFGKQLNIENMKLAANEFVGLHNFKRYTSKPSPKTNFERNILMATIEENKILSGSFIPEESYVFKVKSRGFLRYQVRLMMGALVDVGRGEWTIDDIKQSLIDYDGVQVKHIAPSSSLILYRVIL